MSECSHKILAHDKNGYISICPLCGHIQLAFLTTLLSLNREQFDAFQSQTTNQLNCGKERMNDMHKAFVIHTFSSNSRMVLSFSELQKLIYLLDEATAAIEVQSLVDEKLKSKPTVFKNDTLTQIPKITYDINLN